MKETDLQNLRERIRKKDEKIVRLLNERAAISVAVGRVKHTEGRDVYDPSQESRIYRYLEESNGGPLPADALSDIFREILSASRALQEELTVSYLGPEASFTHLAALSHFGKKAKLCPQATVAEVFEEVERGNVRLGVVPAENSAEGSVKSTLERLISTPLMIQAEAFLRIRHMLLASHGRLGALRKVYSHPQALAQCRQWLRNNLPRCTVIETDSTAGAAERALADREAAAIGSSAAASRYGLKILAEGIEDHRSNTTRFFVVGNGKTDPTGRDKTSILFGTTHVPGALHQALASFAGEKVNLTRIESHPMRDRMWEYLFFADFIGHMEEEKTKRCIRQLKKKTAFLKILGSYPRGDEGI